MPGYIGDFSLGATFDTLFTSVYTNGKPVTLDTGSAYIFADNGTTSITAGVTTTLNVAAVAGLNGIRVVATSGNGYATAKNYHIMINGSISDIPVSGYMVASFSIENRNTQANLTRWNGVSVTASTLLPVVVRMWDTISVSASNVAVTDFSTRLNANVQQWSGASVSTNNIAILATLAKTTHITGFNDVSKNSISVVSYSTVMTESYAGSQSAMTVPQIMYSIWSFLTDFGIVGTTYTAKKLDKATTAMTFSLDSAVTPTAIVRET